jgi:hypothetical protein
MNKPKLTVEQQVKEAERDKLLAEADKARAEKIKIDLESKELLEEQSKSWWTKKSNLKGIIGAIIAIPLMAFYFDYVIGPVSEIHNVELTLENAKKSDTLNLKEKQLKQANDTLHQNQIYLSQVAKVVFQEKEANARLRQARHRVDSSNLLLYKLYTRKRSTNYNELHIEIEKFKDYLNDYKHELKEESKIPIYTSYPFTLPSNNVPLKENSVPIFGAGGYNDRFNLDSFKKSIGHQSLGDIGNLSPNDLVIRPLLNGVLIKDLKIRLVRQYILLDGNQIFISGEDIEVSYADNGAYSMQTPVGDYLFTLNNDAYTITDIRSSNFMIPVNGATVTFSKFLAPTIGSGITNTIDLILQKK